MSRNNEKKHSEEQLSDAEAQDELVMGIHESAEDEVAVEETETDQIAALEAENVELKENLLRVVAEAQNTRKRLERQKQDALKYRHQDILIDLAEVIDNFERAIESAAESRNFESFHEGILMIEKQFSGMLAERYHMERIGMAGEVFDPTIHEAMMVEESADVDTQTVKQVFQSGYRLYDRVLRPAKVIISKPVANAADNENTDEED